MQLSPWGNKGGRTRITNRNREYLAGCIGRRYSIATHDQWEIAIERRVITLALTGSLVVFSGTTSPPCCSPDGINGVISNESGVKTYPRFLGSNSTTPSAQGLLINRTFIDVVADRRSLHGCRIRSGLSLHFIFLQNAVDCRGVQSVGPKKKEGTP